MKRSKLQNHASLVFSNKVSQKAEDQDDDDDSSGSEEEDWY
jgi:hypothetical protein